MLLTELNFQIKTKTTLKNELFTGLVSKKKNNDEPGEGKHTSKLTMYM